jgi:hypothetical protein
MFADLEFTDLSFDASFLESYLLALLAVGALAYGLNRFLNRGTEYNPDELRGRSRLRPEPPPPAPELAVPAPATAEPAPPASPRALWPTGLVRLPPKESTAKANRRVSDRRKGKPKKVYLADPATGATIGTCWVIDRSRSGLGLIVRHPLTLGAILQVKAVDAPDDVEWTPVEVRNCRPRGSKWMVGCRFTTPLPWSVLLLFG